MKESTRVLIQPDGSLRCPYCGGGQFQPKHSTGRKLAFGFASLLASTNEVRCISCGRKYTQKTPMMAPTTYTTGQQYLPTDDKPLPHRPDVT